MPTVKEIPLWIKENSRFLIILLILSLFAFSSGYMIAIEGRKTSESVAGVAQSTSYKKGYEKGQNLGYKRGFAEGKKAEEVISYKKAYRESYLEQFQKAGIKKPKEISLP